tara:strand:- start:1504 stop:1641 length:138 start_codon:yes stop_codon:yes gene_type:complete
MEDLRLQVSYLKFQLPIITKADGFIKCFVHENLKKIQNSHIHYFS